MKQIFYPREYCICNICKKESYEFVRFIDDEKYYEILMPDGYCRTRINNEHYLCKTINNEFTLKCKTDYQQARALVEYLNRRYKIDD